MTTSEKLKNRKIKVPELSNIAIGPHNINDFLSSISKKGADPEYLVVDLFCGAGGTSTGFHMAGNIAKVIACINHDAVAIKSHWANYPEVAHFEEDIRTLNLEPLIQLLNFYRALYPNAKIILWASLECTNFSKAKGGQPRDADSRTLADHLTHLVEAVPEAIYWLMKRHEMFSITEEYKSTLTEAAKRKYRHEVLKNVTGLHVTEVQRLLGCIDADSDVEVKKAIRMIAKRIAVIQVFDRCISNNQHTVFND